METLKIIRNDEYLKPYAEVITDRYLYAVNKEKNLIQGLKNLSEFASGHLYFGLHKLPQGWVIREWAPNATAIYLKGTFNDWQKLETFRFANIGNMETCTSCRWNGKADVANVFRHGLVAWCKMM